MRILRLTIVLALALSGGSAFAAPEAPDWLPRYDLDVDLDVARHHVRVTQRITFTNRHDRPATELVFNVHSHYVPPKGSVDYLFLAKMLEIMRVPASQGIYNGSACEITSAMLLGPTGKSELTFSYRDDLPTALVVPLPEPVTRGKSVSIELAFDFHLPQRQGRWGQWKGVTFLTNWLPVLAHYDDKGWDPVPFVAWHQPFFNEAGVYTARVRLPDDHVVATTGGITAAALVKDGDETRQGLKIGPVIARDFALLASNRYEIWSKKFGPVTIRCVAFSEHEHYAKQILDIAGGAVETFSKWFGPFPYPELTFAESYFGWNGNECSGLVMIDERVFGMPKLMGNYLEYLVTHETCHQWFYNVIGTDGYRETWMDEAFANYFAHRVLNDRRGHNNPLLQYPRGLEWLPNIGREDYRFSSFFGIMKRGELMTPNQEMPQYRHVGNLFAATYDRGGKIVGLIEERLGEAAFLDFMRRIYSRYYFRIIHVKDFQRELEEYTGKSWDEFFTNWLRGAGMSDWAIESVHLKAARGLAGKYNATIILHQKAEHDEPTYLGFSADGETFRLRVPVSPSAGAVSIDDPPCRIEPLPDHRVRVEILLPEKPAQIAIDPDQALPDREPANNYWKPRVRTRLTPAYTFLDENNLTLAYDRTNVIAGPWYYGPSYADPWFTRSTVFGLRVGVNRPEDFAAGVYAGYRTDFRDIAAGFDANWSNVLPKVDIGIHGEKSLFQIGNGGTDLDRAVIYARYIFMEAVSLYTPPIHHVEVFGSWQRNFLPEPRNRPPGTTRFDTLSDVGIHYHADFLTPYWDPELGFRFDATYAAGFPILGQDQQAHRLTSQLSWVISPPTDLGWFSNTKLAFRAYGAYASPRNGLLFSLGGNLLFRGFDLEERQGSRVWIGSVEWRLPLILESKVDVLDHVLGLRNLYVVPFYDVGEVYANGKSIGGVAHAVGVGVRADVAWLSFIERTSLRLDVAKAINSAAPVQVWIGIQHPF